MIDLRLGDCLEVMKTLPDGSVDAVVTDPPYCSGAHEAAKRAKRSAKTPESVKERPIIHSDSMGTLGFDWVTRRWLLEARRVTAGGGHLVCFTDWRMLPPLATIVEAAGWRWNNVIVWDKGYAGLGAGFRAQHEFVIVASNGAPKWHSWDFGNVLRATRLTATEHPHQKPIELFEPIFRTCVDNSASVLDPFMGSGTTGVACVQTGRNFIGIEIDPGYFEIAKKRIEDAQLQMRMDI